MPVERFELEYSHSCDDNAYGITHVVSVSRIIGSVLDNL